MAEAPVCLHTDIIDMAHAMEAAINDELDDVAEKIEDAEARIAAEDGGWAAKSDEGDDDDNDNGEPTF